LVRFVDPLSTRSWSARPGLKYKAALGIAYGAGLIARDKWPRHGCAAQCKELMVSLPLQPLVKRDGRCRSQGGLWFILIAPVGAHSRGSSPRSDPEVSQFSPPLWPGCTEPTADPAGQSPSPDLVSPDVYRRFLGQCFKNIVLLTGLACPDALERQHPPPRGQQSDGNGC
jgi:hypothetical protein